MTTASVQFACNRRVTYRVPARPDVARTGYVDPAKLATDDAFLHGVDCFGQFVTIARSWIVATPRCARCAAVHAPSVPCASLMGAVRS